MIRRRVISQLLVVTALFTALGTDYMAEAGAAVRAEAMVNVAERMAARFSHAFERKDHQPAAVRFQGCRPALMVTEFIPAAQNQGLARLTLAELQLLYLPPPGLA